MLTQSFLNELSNRWHCARRIHLSSSTDTSMHSSCDGPKRQTSYTQQATKRTRRTHSLKILICFVCEPACCFVFIVFVVLFRFAPIFDLCVAIASPARTYTRALCSLHPFQFYKFHVKRKILALFWDAPAGRMRRHTHTYERDTRQAIHQTCDAWVRSIRSARCNATEKCTHTHIRFGWISRLLPPSFYVRGETPPDISSGRNGIFRFFSLLLIISLCRRLFNDSLTITCASGLWAAASWSSAEGMNRYRSNCQTQLIPF